MNANCEREELKDLVDRTVGNMLESGERFSDAAIMLALLDMDEKRSFVADERPIVAAIIAELVRRDMDATRAQETLEQLHTKR